MLEWWWCEMKTGDNSKKSIVKIKKWIGDGKRQNMSDGENKRKKILIW